jgi:hypothetical protein
MSSHDQYLAVKADLKQRYPDAERISLGRLSFNMVYADIEAVDLHHTVTYFFKGSRIDDSWVRVVKTKCTESCLHHQYPQTDPHALLPDHLSSADSTRRKPTASARLASRVRSVNDVD